MNFIIYDIEATCWKTKGEAYQKRQEIIEIGALKIDDDGQILSTYSTFVRPVFHPTLSDFCQQLTSIHQVDVNKAEPFDQIIENFKEWTGMYDEDYLLCSWGCFDRSIFIKNCLMYDLESEWAKQHISLKHQYPRIIGTGREVGLKRAVVNEGFDFDGMHHRAISDAENLAKIFIKYLPLWRF